MEQSYTSEGNSKIPSELKQGLWKSASEQVMSNKLLLALNFYTRQTVAALCQENHPESGTSKQHNRICSMCIERGREERKNASIHTIKIHA